ncbi:MAG TPA: beta-N-acetylhexosaminidase [Burkholderiales bacterium]|jgi:Beta-glucosidase-related glycosidases
MSEPRVMPLGPVMIDVMGTELTGDDVRRLVHPLTGGVILFTRNFSAPEQLVVLTARIHGLRSPALIVAVDHEGGRVQRFRDGYTRIPPMRVLGRCWDKNPQRAKRLAQDIGFVLAAELRAHGIDLSFAPVLDLDYGASSVIGDRAFHVDPYAVSELARALIHGLKEGGMSAVGKHFPGHGHVQADSHVAVPVDERTYAQIEALDLVPFARLSQAGLGGIMPAHVIYPHVDDHPAGFSQVWLKDVLRGRLRFEGVIFSDDLSMEAASVAGGVTERARAAVEAGCDMVLVCNDPDAVDRLYSEFRHPLSAVALARLARMHGRSDSRSMTGLREDSRYVTALQALAGLSDDSGSLPLA